MLLIVTMLITLATPAFATSVNEYFPEDALIIEVNTIEELLDAQRMQVPPSETVIIILGPDLCPDEAYLASGRERGVLFALTILIANFGNTVIARIGVTGVITIYRVATGLWSFAEAHRRAGTTGTIRWHGGACGLIHCCGRC